MANTILHKRSSSASAAPTTGDLSLGEIAINTFDGKLFIKKDNGTASVVEIGGGSFLPLSGGTLTGTLNGTDITVTGTVTAAHFDNVSDAVLKEDIVPLPDVSSALQSLTPVSFKWRNSDRYSYGLVAQDVEDVLPTLVRKREDGVKTVNYVELVALLLREVQSLRDELRGIRSSINLPSNP